VSCSIYLFILRAVRSGDWIPVGGEIFCTRPDRPWGPPSLLYNGYRVSFPGLKRPGRGVDHPPTSSARVKERVELHLYSSSGPSWPVLGRTLPFIVRSVVICSLLRMLSLTQTVLVFGFCDESNEHCGSITEFLVLCTYHVLKEGTLLRSYM
jgi:hypothetical protein